MIDQLNADVIPYVESFIARILIMHKEISGLLLDLMIVASAICAGIMAYIGVSR